MPAMPRSHLDHVGERPPDARSQLSLPEPRKLPQPECGSSRLNSRSLWQRSRRRSPADFAGRASGCRRVSSPRPSRSTERLVSGRRPVGVYTVQHAIESSIRIETPFSARAQAARSGTLRHQTLRFRQVEGVGGGDRTTRWHRREANGMPLPSRCQHRERSAPRRISFPSG